MPIPAGGGGEIQDDSGKIPRDLSLLQRAQLERVEEQELVQISVLTPSLLSIHLGTPE